MYSRFKESLLFKVKKNKQISRQIGDINGITLFTDNPSQSRVHITKISNNDLNSAFELWLNSEVGAA